MISLLARRPKLLHPYKPFYLLLCNNTYSNLASNEPRRRTDHQQHKQQIIERKKADVDAFIKQGIVKKAADLVKSSINVLDAEHIRESDDPFYNVPSSSSGDGEEREYILVDESKRKRKRKKTPGEGDEQSQIIEITKKEAPAISVHAHCYPDWCAYYQPIFEQSPYSLGFQQPDENGRYSWSFALETASKMVFGNEEFRPLQLETLNTSLRGEDVFLSLPTGGGKSLCFWLRALLSPGVVIVVSPLVALMHDQLQKLTSRGVPVLRLDSSTKTAAMKALRKESLPYKLIYLTPERMRSTEFLEILRNLYSKDLISMVAIDEAHCISEWGHDFRPSYRRLGIFREEFPNLPIMAMTATATPQVQKDILKNLHIEDTATIFEASFNRPNIYYEVRPKVMVTDDIAHFISSEKYSKASGLIYCLTKNEAQELADELRSRNIHASPYHGSMPASARAQIQDAWKDGAIKVLCTTTAFGLGVDKSDLRYVIHHTVPLSLEAYYQQTGRAGRDGLDSTYFIRATKMLAAAHSNNPNQPAIDDSDHLFDSASPVGVKVDLMDNVVTYCSEEKKCRREILLAYFGEKIHRSACNHKCDNCQRVLVGKVKFKALQNLLPPSDFLPPPHISTLDNPSPQQIARGKEPDPQAKQKEGEEEEKEVLSPLEKLRRRKLARKEWKQAKLLHPAKGRTPAVFYDKVSKARSKLARDKIRLYKSLKSEQEARVERIREAHFNPEQTNSDKEIHGTSDPNRFVKSPQINKTGALPKTSTSPPASRFNSLRNSAKEKVNKTGRVTVDTEDDESTSRSKPKHILSVLRKHNSLQFKSNKLNKTGKVDDSVDGKPVPPKFGNSLRTSTKEKLNKTGKVVAEVEEPTRTYNRFQPKEKLNKTGKIDTRDMEMTRTFTNRTQRLKPNKTGRLAEPTSTSEATPSSSSTSSQTNITTSNLISISTSTSTSQSETSLFTNEKPKLRDIMAKLQASSIASTANSSSASAALHVPTKAAVASLSSLKQVYNEIARGSKEMLGGSVGFFTESVMLQIWNKKPTSILELTSIPGVGSQNATKYADKILPLFRK